MIFNSSPTVRLVNHCFTTRTGLVQPFTGRICSTVLDKDGGLYSAFFKISFINFFSDSTDDFKYNLLFSPFEPS